MRIRSQFLLLIVILLSAAVAYAAQPEVQVIGPIKVHVPDAVKSALSDSGYRIVADGGVLAEIWPAKSASGEKSGSAAALYPNFVSGCFYGVITFPNGGSDFRGQKIPAGTYSLRYQLLPGDGNHLGVAPNPDFFLLVPVDVDQAPADKIPYPALVKLSAKAAGTSHPAAFSLASAGDKSPGVLTDDPGHVIATIPFKAGSTDIKVGMIVKGSAEQ